MDREGNKNNLKEYK